MNQDDLLKRLDQEFVFIMDFSKCFGLRLGNFTNDDNARFKIWLHKLCVEPYETITRKRLRNAYGCKLLTCMAMGQLTGPFTEIPRLGHLEPIRIKTAVDPDPEWLKEYVSTNVNSNSKHCKTYMASKVLDNDKGACAYVAVTMNDTDLTKPHMKEA